ncbi:MAG: PAS domain S-box protein, partial [Myxococcota bacterium]|nr:PAS domain S-box protein [Myxococcota bacterium]
MQDLDSGAFPVGALEARLRKYRKLVEHCTYGMLQCGADGTIVDVGPSGGVLGSAREQVGQNLADLVHPEDRRLVFDLLERVTAQHGARATAEYRMRAANGGWRWTEATATNLLQDPDVEAIVLTEQDDGRSHAAALDELSQRCAALSSELSIFTQISEAVLNDGDIKAALEQTLAGCLETSGIAAGALYLLDDEQRFGVIPLGSQPGWDTARLATFFGQESVLRQVLAWNVPTELPSSSVPEAASLEVLQGFASSFVVVIPLRGESGPLGACVLASRVRNANQRGFLRFAAGVGNQITQVLALTSALAEKEKLRREASEQARLMRLILDNMNEGVLVVDRERRVLLHNKTTVALGPAAVGSRIEERIESLQVTHADGKTPLRTEDTPVIRAANGESVDDAEICLRPPGTGQLRRFHVTARPLITDSGELRGGMVVFRDITEQRRVEQEILESRARWQSLVEHAPDFILNVDRDGIVRAINRVAPGFEREDVVGTPLGAGVPPEDQDKIRDALRDCIAKGKSTAYEVPTATADGGLRWYSSVLGPIRRNGEITGAVVIARDITEKKLTDTQLIGADRMASLGALASGIAHEINSPLASLLVNLTLACRDAEVAAAGHELCGPLLEELNDTREAAERLRQIVLDLRIFTARDGARRGAVNVEELLESTLRSARYEIRHRARLVTDYGKVPLVSADEARLGQVFLNLVLNATQAIREGNAPGNEIRVTTRLEADRVVVRIADTGEGIPPEAQVHVFTPLFTTKPRGIVTGLGLSVCKKIITELGGEIGFQSEVGHGTEFRIVLPRSPDEVRPATERERPKP